VVVGAGLAGLAAAEALSRDGREVHVLEAHDAVGGRVRSVPFAGAVVERGAEFVLPDHDVLLGACDRLGLRLYPKGTPYGVREPRGGAPTSLAAIADAWDTFRAAPPPSADTTIPDALDAVALDPAAREAMVARLEISTSGAVEGQSAAVLAESGAAVGLFDTYTIEGGNVRLAERLAEGVSGGVHLRSPVSRVSWGDDGVRVAHAGGELEGAACIVAVPALTAGAIAYDPPLPAATARAVARVRVGQAAKLFVPLATRVGPSAVLAVPERFWTWTGLGPDGSELPVAGSFVGSPAGVERMRLDEGPGYWLTRVRALRPELDLADAEPFLSTWHDDPWIRGAYSVQTADDALADPALRTPVGPLAFAGEHTAGDWHALMEGALRSGLRAADDVRASLGRYS
jgi:monoamine oxidase